MGRIGRLLKTKIENFIVATIETRKNYNQSVEMFAAAGDDAPPLPEDRILAVGTDGTGESAGAGVLMVSRGAAAGERILYSRSSDGAVQAKIHLKGDGGVEVFAGAGGGKAAVKIGADGSAEIESEGGIALSLKGDVAAEAQNMAFRASAAKFDKAGGTLEVKGTASPTGQGAFCGIPFCPFSGAAHVGTKITITG